MGYAVENTVDALRVARIDLEVAIVLKVSAECRQCPCFAADRECEPDVCRSCWISCGDGTLGVLSQRGDNYECRNMKLLLQQQQKASAWEV
ncbi:hypothetical protein VitviT2T_006823 [Vitis vinifera]|uniref:CXC domain-containing protein n=2 Tax=Vitis vinifera TaxID=29760 RepID=A0ABY9BY68_VITVI|nr:hypothetical protein VitviT2T_006823 [Vitis vinifera]